MVIIDSGLKEKYHREEMRHIYFEEKLNLNESDLVKMDEYCVLVTELKEKLEDVIPLGYICEDFIHHFNNENF